jgi:hypothetical protein
MIVRTVFDRIAATMTNIKNHAQNLLSDLFRLFQGGWTSPLQGSLVISIALFSIQLFFIKPFFLTNDDIFKILAVKGIGPFSSPSAYVGYSNVLLGYVLIKLFSWFPTFSWYSWFLCLTQLFTFWAFLWLLCLKSTGRFNAMLFIGAWIGNYYIFFSFLQFTMTAGLAAGTGILLFCLAPESFGGFRRKGLMVVSAALVVLAALIRNDSLLLMLICALPLVIYRMADFRFRRFAGRNWVWPAGALLLSMAFWVFNYAWFQTDPAWREYKQFDRERVELQDYRITEYNFVTKPFFEKVGWSRNDYWLFENWFFANPLKYNARNFEKLKREFPRLGTSGKTASFQSLGELFRSFWDQRVILLFFVFFALCRGAPMRILLAQFVWVMLVLLFLIYLYRAPDRVSLPALVFVMNLSFFFAEAPGLESGMKKVRTRCVFWGRMIMLAAVLVVCLPGPLENFSQNLLLRNTEKGLQDCLNQMNPRDDRLFVVWDFPFESLGAFNNFECFRHFHMFASVFSQTCPANLETLRRFGVRDPFRDAVDNPNVFLNCTLEQGLHYRDYLKENYGLEITARRFFACGYFKVFSIRSMAAEKRLEHKTEILNLK